MKKDELVDVTYTFRKYENCRIPENVVNQGEEAMIAYIRDNFDDVDGIEIISYQNSKD